MEPQEVHESHSSNVEDMALWEIPDEVWRWTPLPAALDQGHAESVAEFRRSDYEDPTVGDSWMNSHDRRLATVALGQTASAPERDPLIAQHGAAGSTLIEGSTEMFPTVPVGDALFSRNNAAVGMPALNNDDVRSLFDMNYGSHHQASWMPPTRSPSTASSAPPAGPAASSSTHTPLNTTVASIPMPTDVQAQPRPFIRQESYAQSASAATGGRNIPGVRVPWEPLNVNGVRVLYAVHGFHYVVDPTSLPFGAAPNAVHAPGAGRPGFFVATSGPVDPRSVYPTRSDVASSAAGEQGHGNSQNTTMAATTRPTRPLPARRRQRRSGPSAPQTPTDPYSVQASPSPRHTSGRLRAADHPKAEPAPGEERAR